MGARLWGRGYATDGALALVAHGLSDGVRRIFAHALESNPDSIRVMQKAGLGYVGPWSYRGLAGVEYAVAR